jgi:hypothetical protein
VRTAEREREEARQRVAAHLVATVPALGLGQALVVMAEAGVRHVALHAVDRHLIAHPDALRTGDPDSPAGLERLVQTLHKAGFTTVALIGCARCGTTGGRLAWRSAAGRICGRCARQTTEKHPCAHCGRVAVLEGRRLDGRICGSCVASDPATFDDCSGCGRHARPFRRLADGSALCQRCAPQPLHRCSVCGHSAPAAARTPTGPVCIRCYPTHAQPHRECSACHQTRPVAVRGSAEHGDLCARCAPDPVGTCTGCGRDRPGRFRAGAFVCHTCRAAARPGRRCALCHQHRQINNDWPLGPVCAAPAPSRALRRLRTAPRADRRR